jgi:hypothetical protein
MARDRFQNPVNGLVYNWPVNHSDEEAVGKTRPISATAPTGTGLLVRQQGEDAPMQIKWSGTIFHRSQFQQMWAWFNLSRLQSVYLYDYDNQGYEVLITEFQPVRKRTLRNPRDPSVPYHYWTYTITFDVLTFIAGDMAAMGVAP